MRLLHKSAIDHQIGGDWSLDEIKDRCRFVRHKGDNFQILELDGKPILKLAVDLEFDNPSDALGLGSTIVAKQSYEFL